MTFTSKLEDEPEIIPRENILCIFEITNTTNIHLLQ